MLQLTASTVTAMLVYLGVEADEGADPNELLDDTLSNYNLTRDQFVTEETCFALGYHRGMAARSLSEEQAPLNGDKVDETLFQAIEDGYGYGLESRDLKLSPPPSLVFEAHKSGVLTQGNMAGWASKLDLSSGHRLAQSITVGSGKDAAVIPAGTPVDLLAEGVQKDGVAHVIVLYDGSALLIPNPDDSPRVVTATTEIAPAVKTRKARKGKEGATPGKKREAKERGPSLKDAIIYVIEGQDGGPGPLQTNGSFANRVLKRCRDLGIGDKAGSFVQKADRHVPYYLNCYKPNDTDGKALTGRLGVESPLSWVCAAIEARKYFLKGDASLSQDERMAQVPDEHRKSMQDRDSRLATEAPPAKPAKAKADDATGDDGNGVTEPEATEPEAVVEEPKAKKGKGKKAK